MPETLVENRDCSACGVDVRKDALFCYNCGGSVTPEIAAPDNHKPVSDAWFREDIAEEEPREEDFASNEKITEAKTEILEKPDIPVEKPEIIEEEKLKSAASLRRRSKSIQKIRIEEVVWEEPDSSPNGWFIFVALVLTLFAVGIFLLAIYLK